jgi:hypothetical protein
MALCSFGALESDGRADPPPATVVLLSPATSDAVTAEAMARVRGELKAAGFEVAIIPFTGDVAKRDLETAGRDRNAIAAFAIFVHPSQGGTSVAEIWVSDRVRQKTVMQNALLYDTDRGRGSEILAVRAVELLKANLADFWAPAAPAPSAAPHPAPPPPPTLPASEAEQTSRPSFASGVGVGLGAGFMAGFSAKGTTWAPEVMASYGWPLGFGLRASFVGLGQPETFSADAGSAVVEQQLAAFEAVKTWWPRAALVPFAFAGTGAQHAHVTGTGKFPYQGHTSDDWSLLTTLGAGVGIPLVSILSLVVQARGLAAWPSGVVQIAGAEAGRVGAPSLLVDGGLVGVIR